MCDASRYSDKKKQNARKIEIEYSRKIDYNVESQNDSILYFNK